MSKKYYLKLDGVRGESREPRHYEEMELSSLYINTGRAGASGGAGKAQLADITVTKRTDTTSPVLWVASTTGQSFKSGVITIEDIGGYGTTVRYQTLSMTDIMIQSFRGVYESDEVTLNIGGFKMQEGKFASHMEP